VSSAGATPVSPGTVNYNLTYAYDRYGNMTCTHGSPGSMNCPALTFNTSNRITNVGYNYDAAGNLMADGTHTYQWDAEGRMVSVDGVAGQACQSTWTACYVYNAQGQRVRKTVRGVNTEILYNAEGEVIAYFNGNTSLENYFPLAAGWRPRPRQDLEVTALATGVTATPGTRRHGWPPPPRARVAHTPMHRGVRSGQGSPRTPTPGTRRDGRRLPPRPLAGLPPRLTHIMLWASACSWWRRRILTIT